jgi:1,2-diacylglycerol 3-beta-glucosyltransferase
VSQEALPSLRRLLTQRTRWAQGNIQCVKYLKHIFKSPNFDSTGVLETSYYLILPFLQMLGGIAFLLGWGWTLFLVSHDNLAANNERGELWAVLILIALFSVLPFAIWGFVYKLRCEREATWLQAALWGLAMWLYVYYMYICIARAFIRILRGKTGWSKTRRNAEDHLVLNGSVAVEE